MQKIDRFRSGLTALVLLVGIGMNAHAQTSPAAAEPSSGVKSSIQTVDQLIKLENAQALAKSRPPAPEPSVNRARVFAPPPPVAPTFSVESIYGAGRLSADVTINGQVREGVRQGTVLGRCSVREIANQCVVLTPAAASTPANLCPRACWTGERYQTSSFGSPGGSAMPAPFAGQPMPTPLPGGSVASVPRAPVFPAQQ